MNGCVYSKNFSFTTFYGKKKKGNIENKALEMCRNYVEPIQSRAHISPSLIFGLIFKKIFALILMPKR